MKNRINKIIESWYIYDYPFFATAISHTIAPNSTMACSVRCGAGKIEYNPKRLESKSDALIEELLKVECIRILLEHPYTRLPKDCPKWACALASTLVVADNYKFKTLVLPSPADFSLPKGESYEWYAHHLPDNVTFKPVPAGQDMENLESLTDASANWGEDEFMGLDIAKLKSDIQNANKWGTLPAGLKEKIMEADHGSIDYRKVLAGFRASVLSSRRSLTRMRPNRRLGWEAMGSKREFTSSLLIAVDASGSVSSQELSVFLRVVNQAFKYGIEQLDVMPFDSQVYDIIPMRRAAKVLEITGRGGTDFQPVIDYAAQQRYDGLLIFTDGMAPAPTLPDPCHFSLLWVYTSQEAYDHRVHDLPGRSCYIS